MSITSQYIEATRKMQENWFSAVDSMTAQFAEKFERPSAATVPVMVDPRKAVDELFDFYGKALAVQRETAHKILDANMQANDQWTEQAERFYAAWREQAQTLTQTAREQMENFATSAREQAQQLSETVEARVADAQQAGREQAERFTTAATEQTRRATEAAATQTRRATEAAKETSEEATDTATEQVKRNYNLMNTAQLKSELTTRGLETTGSLDELRARLREADDKA